MVDKYIGWIKIHINPFLIVLLYYRDSLEVIITDVMDILPVKCFWDLLELLVNDQA